MPPKSPIVTRFAPSPTGFMHVGSVRTALYAWLLAKKNHGSFILRIEDTDKEREVAGSILHIQESLRWLGLNWDEFYIQSERLAVYQKYAQKLIGAGHAYMDGEAIRFRIPEKKRMEWQDIVWGGLSAGPEALEDFILIKSDGYPTYNFAHIVDDIEMKVTHVMRGEEFISSTPKFLSVYQALDIEPPYFATLPVILGENGTKKLSKRDGAKDLLEYREDGYLPDAFINFLALLGWNPGDEREIFSREELIEAFDIERIQKSGARMSLEKLDWINREHMKRLPEEVIQQKIISRMPEEIKETEIGKKLVSLIFERISKWGDVKKLFVEGEFDFFFRPPEVPKDKLIYKDVSAEKIAGNLKLAIEALENVPGDFNADNIKRALMLIADNMESRPASAKASTGKGELLHPVRFALTGRDKSPDPFLVASILGKDETIRRLQKAI